MDWHHDQKTMVQYIRNPFWKFSKILVMMILSLVHQTVYLIWMNTIILSNGVSSCWQDWTKVSAFP